MNGLPSVRVALFIRESGSESPCRWFYVTGIYKYKIAAVLRSRNNITLEITEQASASYFLCIWMAGTIVILQDSSIKMEFYRRLYRENSIRLVKSRFRSQNPGTIIVIRQIKRCLFRQIKTGLSEHLTME